MRFLILSLSFWITFGATSASANIFAIHLKNKKVSVEVVRTKLDEINSKRFLNTLKIEEMYPQNEDPTFQEWRIFLSNGTRNVFLFTLLYSVEKKRISRSGGGYLEEEWAALVFLNELSAAFKSKIYDEDDSGKSWMGKAGKYPTYRSYLDLLFPNPKTINIADLEYDRTDTVIKKLDAKLKKKMGSNGRCDQDL